MAVEIDTSEGVENLTDDELFYLLQRERMVPEVTAEMNNRGLDPHYNHDPVAQLQSVPNYGDSNAGKMAPPPRTREEGEDDDTYLQAMEVKPENLTKPQLVGVDDEDEDEDDEGEDFDFPDNEDYETWTNDQLRAKISELTPEGEQPALDGKKSVLVAEVHRLLDDDSA